MATNLIIYIYIYIVGVKILLILLLRCPKNFILPTEPCKNYTLKSWPSCPLKFSKKPATILTWNPASQDLNVNFSLPSVITSEVEKIPRNPYFYNPLYKSRTRVRRSTRPQKKKQNVAHRFHIKEPPFSDQIVFCQKDPSERKPQNQQTNIETKRSHRNPNKKGKSQKWRRQQQQEERPFHAK